MRILLSIVAASLLISAPAAAQSAQPFKLIVRWQGAGIAITEYPSKARCEAGRLSLLSNLKAQFPARPPQSLPGGGVIYTPGVIVDAICFAG